MTVELQTPQAPTPPRGKELPEDKRAQMRAHQYTEDGQLKSLVGRQQKSSLRERAAEIALDMEEHVFIDRRSGKPWQGSYSKSEIAVAMGYSKPVAGNHANATRYPVFLREPEFGRYVDYERIKRTAKSKMTIGEARPIISTIAGALMLEVARRALLEPKSIANSDLLKETRHYIGELRNIDGQSERGGDVTITINLFERSLEGLPPAAQKIARELFGSDLKRLTAVAGGKVVDTTAKAS